MPVDVIVLFVASCPLSRSRRFIPGAGFCIIRDKFAW
jgi:hypothetical protein